MNERNDKEENIIAELRRRAKEDVRFGSMTIEFKVQDGKIVSGEIIEHKMRLG